MSVAQYGKLADRVGDGVELVPAGGLVEKLRAVKDRGELAAMRAAAELADAVYRDIQERGLVGRTEREVARRRGAADGATSVPRTPRSRRSWRPPGTARCRTPCRATWRSRATRWWSSTWAARLDGYCSDCTRTFATGDFAHEAVRGVRAGAAAQEESLAAVRAGAEGRAVDAVARDRIDAAGPRRALRPRPGPRRGPRDARGAAPGADGRGRARSRNVVTVEPGVYLPGEFGVRIEDLVIVTDDGAEVLSHFPKPLITLGA